MSQTHELGRYCKVSVLEAFRPAFLDTISLWDATTGVASEIILLWFATILIVAGGLLAWLAPAQRKQIKASVVLFGLSLAGAFLAAFFRSSGHSLPAGFLVGFASLLEGVVLINLAAVLIFDVCLGSLRVNFPRILRYLVVAVAYVTLILTYLSYKGVNVSGIVATSAVITAVIAFSLQDTLGNIMGGLALQMERTINVGDWIEVDKHVGRVVELRWRQTTIETRKWNTVIIPNSQLMKSQIVIVGRRIGEPVQQRQELYFHVDPRHTPMEVIATVEEALRSSPMHGVA